MGVVVVIGGPDVRWPVEHHLLVGISALIYGAGLFILRGFKMEEIRFFRGLLRV